MRVSLMTIPMILAIVALLYVVFRSLLRTWIEHRVRMTILERAEQNPEMLKLVEESQSSRNIPTHGQHRPGADPAITGLILGLMGFVFVLINGLLGRTQWAVGAYFGGVACVVVGFVLAAVGLLARVLDSTSSGARKKE